MSVTYASCEQTHRSVTSRRGRRAGPNKQMNGGQRRFYYARDKSFDSLGMQPSRGKHPYPESDPSSGYRLITFSQVQGQKEHWKVVITITWNF